MTLSLFSHFGSSSYKKQDWGIPYKTLLECLIQTNSLFKFCLFAGKQGFFVYVITTPFQNKITTISRQGSTSVPFNLSSDDMRLTPLSFKSLILLVI